MDLLWWFGMAIVLPLLFAAVVDVSALWRSLHTPLQESGDVPPNFDFEILIPIYGSMSYFETAEALHRYGDRVVLCTTRGESVEFYRDLRAVMDKHGFRVFVGNVHRSVGACKRATGGVVRDQIIRDALAEVRATYVVCLDADTVVSEPIERLVGAIAARDLDLASVRLVPSNPHTLLAKLQAHEYRIAMDMRRIMPWLISGGCHGGRTDAMRAVMGRHSLFFQGQDIEIGVIGDSLKMRIGYVPTEVTTTVPERFWPWWRQRLSWSSGAFRLFVINPQFSLRHPFMWTYGLLIGIALLPWKWTSLAPTGWRLLLLAVFYIVTCALAYRGSWDRALFAIPLYAAVNSLVLVPLGFLWYLKTVHEFGNIGLIRPRRDPTHVPPAGSSYSPPRVPVVLR